MAITPMTFKVEITRDEWFDHPLRKEWWTNPAYAHSTINVMLKTYNINLIEFQFNKSCDGVTIEFQSEQDYILWKLHH